MVAYLATRSALTVFLSAKVMLAWARVLAGLATGTAILAAIGVILLRSSARLPISQFFAFSSALVAVLAIVLMGKGVAALQKIGYLEITPITMPRIDVLGVYTFEFKELAVKRGGGRRPSDFGDGQGAWT